MRSQCVAAGRRFLEMIPLANERMAIHIFQDSTFLYFLCFFQVLYFFYCSDACSAADDLVESQGQEYSAKAPHLDSFD